MLIAEAKGELLTLLQDNDREGGFATEGWSDEVYQASVRLGEAEDHLTNAELA